MAVALLGLAMLAAAAPLPAQPSRMEKATLEAVADRTAYAPGETARVAAVMEIEEGWHANSHEPTFDYLIGTEVAIEPPAGWELEGIDYPPGEMKTFGFSEEPLSVYDGRVATVARLAVPAGAAAGGHETTVRLTYQACDDSSCLPPVTTSETVVLTVGGGGEPVARWASLTAPAAGDGRDGTGVGGAGPGLLLILFLGLVGGLILNAMPCVLPVLSLKVFGLVKSAGQGRASVVAGALGTAGGILVSFWALAAAAIAARSAGAAVGWGVQFQEPLFVTFLALVVVLFCLNLWGLFEIPLPGALARVANAGPTEGLPGHFASGLFATLMATPCSAPFLGTAVGFALAQPAPVILAVFTAVGTGMALPYLFLAVAPRTAALLPKPGRWMDTVKVVMGFLLAGAAVWLFYVLSAQVSAERLAFIELSLLALAMFVWLRQRATGGRAARMLATAGIVATVAAGLVLAAGAGDAEARSAAAAAGGGEETIPWVTFDRSEAESLAEAGRLVFVDVTADWCFTCKVNERLVLADEAVGAAFEEHDVVPMKADWTNRDDAIGDYLASFGKYGIPFYVLYRPGAEPHVFSELLTRGEVLGALEAAADSRLRASFP